ncbi:hypothetical protein C2S51_037739 [Perilla frutescens var. frutescens]|nr:hypothetical protein C2S51_037739 [Perilla frutescens var. frutescens]
MDFNLKSKFWAGSIYHQFESICQDVDGFVNKDTVKFVGNQVQSVGISVKRLYSNVVQDILPLSGDIANPKEQLAAGEQVDMQDHVSVTGIRTTLTCTDEKQFPKNQVSDDHKMRISEPSDFPEAQICQHLREHGNAIVQNSEESSCSENNVTKDLKPVTADSCFDGEILSEKSDEDYISSSPAFSACEENSTSIIEEEQRDNHQKGEKDFSDDTVCLSDTSSTRWLSESKLPMVADPYSDENGSLSSPPVPVSTHKDNYQLSDSPLPPAFDTDDWASEKDRSLCESCYTKDENVDLSTSVQSSEHVFSCYSCNEKEQMDIMPSTHCTSPNSSLIMESTSVDFLMKAENVLHSRSVSDGCTSNISAASFINAADKSKAVDVDPAFLILESNDNNALQTDRSEFVIGLSESGHEEHYEDGFSSETANIYAFGVPIGDLDLETVHLSPNVKHDGRRVVLNSNSVLAGSYRRRNFRYYKNLIQGAFTSRKRLSKEYEHLAIMYGDIDVESNHHFKPSSPSSFPNTALQDVAGTQSSREMSENEWELL